MAAQPLSVGPGRPPMRRGPAGTSRRPRPERRCATTARVNAPHTRSRRPIGHGRRRRLRRDGHGQIDPIYAPFSAGPGGRPLAQGRRSLACPRERPGAIAAQAVRPRRRLAAESAFHRMSLASGMAFRRPGARRSWCPGLPKTRPFAPRQSRGAPRRKASFGPVPAIADPSRSGLRDREPPEGRSESRPMRRQPRRRDRRAPGSRRAAQSMQEKVRTSPASSLWA